MGSNSQEHRQYQGSYLHINGLYNFRIIFVPANVTIKQQTGFFQKDLTTCAYLLIFRLMENTDLALLRAAIQRFVSLGDDEWEMLAPHVSYREVPRGGKWISEGEREKDIGLVLSGNMRHYYTRDGEEKTTYFYFENHIISSYISAVTGAPSLLTIEALTDSRLLVFPYQQLRTLFDQSPTWERFGRLVAEYLAFGLEERMVGLLILSPEERYLELLQGNKKKIIERIPQHYIANYLGITPVSLSRIRKRLLDK
jgi:CRP-like cAMP-binding protein